MTKRHREPSGMSSSASSSHSAPYRVFDPARVDEEIDNGAPSVREALEEYERAKHVSERVLEAQVCV